MKNNAFAMKLNINISVDSARQIHVFDRLYNEQNNSFNRIIDKT